MVVHVYIQLLKLISDIIRDVYNHTIILFYKFRKSFGDLTFENIKYKHGLLIFQQLKLKFPFLNI